MSAPVSCGDTNADLDQDPATPCEPCLVGASYDGFTCALAPSDNCGATEFTCSSGDCIDLALVCDGNADCPGGGGEDEASALCAPPCPEGYTGTYCEISIPNACDPDPCLNGATCVDELNGYTCVCPAGYEGANCETNIDDCNPNPCLNGGTCVDGTESYSCSCPSGYTGAHCETQAAAVPYSWFCAPERYGDGQFCDCSCGAVDPDCSDSGDGFAIADTGCTAGKCDMYSATCATPSSCATNEQCRALACFGDIDCYFGATCNLATNTCSNWDFDPQTAQCRGQFFGGGPEFGFPPFMIGTCAPPSPGTTTDRGACSTDDDCASGSCVNGACSPWCVYDSDCGAGNTCVDVLTPQTTDPTVTPPGSLDIPSLAFRRFCVGGTLATSCDTQGCAAGECRLYFSTVDQPQHFCSDGSIDNGAGGDVDAACTPGSCQAGLLCYQGQCRLPCPPGTPCAGTCTPVTVSDWLTEDTFDDVVVDLCLP